MDEINAIQTVDVDPLYYRRLLRLESIVRVARSNGLACHEQYDQNRLDDWFNGVYRAGE